MNKIQISGLLINLIIYLIMILPTIVISIFPNSFKSKKNFLFSLFIGLIFNITASLILYNYSKNIFEIFTDTPGIINYGIYSSKILFMSSSLYSLKFLIPAYICSQKNIKKVAILIISKIAITLLLILFGIVFFNTKGFLFAIPISDFIFYIIYFVELLKILRYNI